MSILKISKTIFWVILGLTLVALGVDLRSGWVPTNEEFYCALTVYGAAFIFVGLSCD